MEFLLDVCLVVEPQGQDVCFLFFFKVLKSGLILQKYRT